MQPLPSISEELVVTDGIAGGGAGDGDGGGGAAAELLSTTFTTGLAAFLFLGWS